MKYSIQEKFPTISVNTTHGEMIIPEFYNKKGKGFILFSHPSDFTPVCTTEFISLQEAGSELSKLNLELLGLSVDSVEDHHAWVKWIKDNLNEEIKFPIIDDLELKVSNELGLIKPGVVDTSTARSVVFVDANGLIRTILEYPKEFGRNIHEIVRIAKIMNIFDEEQIMAPGNWPNNKTIKDNFLISPSREIDDETAQKYGMEQKSEWFRYTTKIKK
jgi:peroxiredoxin (alkyl hydroperoxide reductase subunit C)